MERWRTKSTEFCGEIINKDLVSIYSPIDKNVNVLLTHYVFLRTIDKQCLVLRYLY